MFPENEDNEFLNIKNQVIQNRIKNDQEIEKKYNKSLNDENEKLKNIIQENRIKEIEKIVDAEKTLVDQQNYRKLMEEEFNNKMIEQEKKRIKEKYEINIYNEKNSLQNIILKIFFWFFLIYILYFVILKFQSILSNL